MTLSSVRLSVHKGKQIIRDTQCFYYIVGSCKPCFTNKKVFPARFSYNAYCKKSCICVTRFFFYFYLRDIPQFHLVAGAQSFSRDSRPFPFPNCIFCLHPHVHTAIASPSVFGSCQSLPLKSHSLFMRVEQNVPMDFYKIKP
jgi:hypothetical protein